MAKLMTISSNQSSSLKFEYWSAHIYLTSAEWAFLGAYRKSKCEVLFKKTKTIPLLNMFLTQKSSWSMLAAWQKSIKDLSTILAVYGTRNWTILAIYGTRNKWEPCWQFMAPEIAISCHFLSPESPPFWWFLVPDYGARNRQKDAVSGAIKCQNGWQILYDI